MCVNVCAYEKLVELSLKRTRNETYSPKLDVGICIPYTY